MIADRLARLGLVDGERGKRTAELSWPRTATGFARLSQRTADAAMIGIVLGPAAIAGLGFAAVYWGFGNRLSTGLAGGTIGQVSQRFGFGSEEQVDLAVKQSVWIGLLLATPFTIVYWLYPAELIALFGAAPRTVEYGAIYLRILGVAMVPNFLNTIASRTLAGADDTWIPMTLRGTGAVLNVVLNAVFIFGLGLGMAGAALGTLLAELFVMVCLVWGFLAGDLPVVGRFPVQLRITRPLFDYELTRDLFVVSVPLMIKDELSAIVRFPFLAILAMFGPVVVAAYEITRLVVGLMNAPGWGFSTSASSLVGQELGKGDLDEAEAFGWDILRFSLAVYIANAALLLVFAPWIAGVFVDDPEAVARTATFLRVSSIAVVGMGVDSSVTGALRASGDTRWPMYGRFVGLYLFMLPLAYLGAVTPVGFIGVYLALIAERCIPAVVSLYRFNSGRWRTVSERYRPQAAG